MLWYRTTPPTGAAGGRGLTIYVTAYVIVSSIAEAEDVTKLSVASSQDTREVFQFILANYLHTPTQHSASPRRRSIKSNTRTHPQINKKKSFQTTRCPKSDQIPISFTTNQPTNQPTQIGEVARVVHYLRKHTLNRTIASCTAVEDTIVYGKVGTSASEFQKAISNRRVTSVGQQGKYFYVTFDKSPHAVMHLGMTGWVKFSSEETGYYRSKKDDKEVEEWPPKYMKWLMKFVKEGERDEVEIAFVDPRRLARIRLVDCEAGEIRNHSPLKENGPDPVVDKEKFTFEFLKALLGKKKVPVKALLLDQANISGEFWYKTLDMHAQPD
jgi:formamidopyrimidine-DNA glycosylase